MAVPMLNRPVFKPLRTEPKRVPGTPMLPMPEVWPLMTVPPLAVLKNPETSTAKGPVGG
ncbi:Uncharacterised protein [Mycobacterium tuberculosis]|nr:Uncharacterised protein [Mycobacterium tuberculosis]